MPRKRPEPVYGYAMLDRLKKIMPNSVGETPAAVRLKAGEGKPIRVLITPIMDDDDE